MFTVSDATTAPRGTEKSEELMQTTAENKTNSTLAPPPTADATNSVADNKSVIVEPSRARRREAQNAILKGILLACVYFVGVILVALWGATTAARICLNDRAHCQRIAN